MELKPLYCRSCGAPIEAGEIDKDLGLVRCRHCGSVYGLEVLPRHDSDGSFRAYERQSVPMPDKLEVADVGNELQITYRWFGLKFVFLIIFAVFWNGFMLLWHGISLASGAWFMSVFGLLHTAVGVGLAYYTLAGLLNKTTIRIGMGQLLIQHWPLPWPGNRQLEASDVAQLFSREKISRSKNSTSYSYQVHALLQNGKKQKLLSGLTDVDQALYVEQEIERYLGIRDRMVRGEIPR
jgi:hypothetical protein